MERLILITNKIPLPQVTPGKLLGESRYRTAPSHCVHMTGMRNALSLCSDLSQISVWFEMGGKGVSFSGKAPRLSHRRWQPPSQAGLAVTVSFNDTSQDLSGKQIAFSPRQKQLRLPASRQKGPSRGRRALREVRPGAAHARRGQALPRGSRGATSAGGHSRLRGREEDRPPPVQAGTHKSTGEGRRRPERPARRRRGRAPQVCRQGRRGGCRAPAAP